MTPEESITAEEAMGRIGQLLDRYYKNELRELAVLARISRVVGAYEGGKS